MGLSKFKKGDMVKIISGKDKGKTGKVLKTIPDKDRLVIEKINLIKKHKRPDQKSKGGILEKEGSVHVSRSACYAVNATPR
ncbi:MAG TPA: 50S ribosomal protein L24, partial [Smithellaceae bacterium]|nr:50S ribosomal protein L24 [Smithellaceae bacterium]